MEEPEEGAHDTYAYETQKDGNVVTWVNVDGKHYTFSPIMLHSMPYRADTSSSWENDITLELKIGGADATGTLVIMKSLNLLAANSVANFTFLVSGLNPAAPSESHAYTVSFSEGAGTKTVVTITDIPYGTELTIEEVTDSQLYEPVGPTSVTVQITEEQPRLPMSLRTK